MLVGILPTVVMRRHHLLLSADAEEGDSKNEVKSTVGVGGDRKVSSFLKSRGKNQAEGVSLNDLALAHRPDPTFHHQISTQEQRGGEQQQEKEGGASSLDPLRRAAGQLSPLDDRASLVESMRRQQQQQLLYLQRDGGMGGTLESYERAASMMLTARPYAAGGHSLYQYPLAYDGSRSMSSLLAAARANMRMSSHLSSILSNTSPLLERDMRTAAAIASAQHRSNLLYPSPAGMMGRIPEDDRVTLPLLEPRRTLTSAGSLLGISMTGLRNLHPVSVPVKAEQKQAKEEETAADRKETIIRKGPELKQLAKRRKPGSRDRRFNSSTPISLVASARSSTTVSLELTGRPPVSMYLDLDVNNLSEYQCFLRKQIELFEAKTEDLQYNAQKMNKAVVLGQVGIRCKHCAHEDPWTRTRGAVYYSASLGGLYQAGTSRGSVLYFHCHP